MSKSNRSGVLSEETTEPRQGSRSTSAGSRSTSAMSATTRSLKTSPKDSQDTLNLQDNTNAVRLIQALAAKLGNSVEWKKLTLGDGREVYALVFPTSQWMIDPDTMELKPR